MQKCSPRITAQPLLKWLPSNIYISRSEWFQMILSHEKFSMKRSMRKWVFLRDDSYITSRDFNDIYKLTVKRKYFLNAFTSYFVMREKQKKSMKTCSRQTFVFNNIGPQMLFPSSPDLFRFPKWNRVSWFFPSRQFPELQRCTQCEINREAGIFSYTTSHHYLKHCGV